MKLNEPKHLRTRARTGIEMPLHGRPLMGPSIKKKYMYIGNVHLRTFFLQMINNIKYIFIFNHLIDLDKHTQCLQFIQFITNTFYNSK